MGLALPFLVGCLLERRLGRAPDVEGAAKRSRYSGLQKVLVTRLFRTIEQRRLGRAAARYSANIRHKQRSFHLAGWRREAPSGLVEFVEIQEKLRLL